MQLPEVGNNNILTKNIFISLSTHSNEEVNLIYISFTIQSITYNIGVHNYKIRPLDTFITKLKYNGSLVGA